MGENATIGALGKVDRYDAFAHVTGGIAITTLGTRGDVQPYIALARGLIAKGHHVTLLAPEQFADLVAEHGVPFFPLPGDILNLIDTPEAKKAVSSSEGFGAGLKLLKHMRPLAEKLLNAEWAAQQFGQRLESTPLWILSRRGCTPQDSAIDLRPA